MTLGHSILGIRNLIRFFQNSNFIIFCFARKPVIPAFLLFSCFFDGILFNYILYKNKEKPVKTDFSLLYDIVNKEKSLYYHTFKNSKYNDQMSSTINNIPQ